MANPTRLSVSPPKTPSTPEPTFTKTGRVISGSTSTSEINKDMNVLRLSDATVIDEWDIALQSSTGTLDTTAAGYRVMLGACRHAWPATPPAAYSNFSLEGWHIRAEGPGTGTVAIYDPKARRSQLYRFDCTLTTPASTDEFQSWVSGSLTHKLNEDTATVEATVTEEALWSTYSPATDTFAYNQSGIAPATGYKIAGFAAWNSSTNSRRKGGVLITPEHVLYTLHYRPNPGDTVKFVEADGTVQTRAIQYVDTITGGFDHVIATLSSPITTIAPIPMVSRADGLAKMPSVSSQTAVGVTPEGDTLAFVLDQQSRCRTLRTRRGGMATSMATITDGSTQFPARAALIGDLGSPSFWMFGDQPVLIGTTTFTTWSGGAATHASPADWEAVTANRGRTPTYLDVASYPSY